MQLNFNSVFVIMDFQQTIVKNMVSTAVSESAIINTLKLREKAREAGVPVLYIKVAFSERYEEIDEWNKLFASIKQLDILKIGDEGTCLDERIIPSVTESVFIKHRVSAFSSSEFSGYLENNKVKTLILAGLSTSGVILSTVRQASDLDYRIIVAEDACGDREEHVHRFLMEDILPMQAEVLDTETIIKLLG